MARRSSKKRTSTKKSFPKRKAVVLRTQDLRTHESDRVLVAVLRAMLSLLLLGIVFLAGAIVMMVVLISILGMLYLKQVSSHAMRPPAEIVTTILSIPKTPLVLTEGRKNILILGTDALANRNAESALTDSIVVLSIQTQTGIIKTFSFPRDLYIASHSAKINSLYEKGKALSPREPEAVIKKTIEDIAGISIHNVLVMDIATVGQIIDALGGLDVEIENTFVDYRFPRTDVDVRIERDPDKLYEVVAFSRGRERMSGDRALRFMRSRHSLDPMEGSDNGRVKRQQRVMAALLTKLKDPMLARNPEQLGKLTKIYLNSFNKALPLPELGRLAYEMMTRHLAPALVSYQFSIDTGENSVFTNPPTHSSGAWVYLPLDPTYAQIKQTVAQWLAQ